MQVRFDSEGRAWMLPDMVDWVRLPTAHKTWKMKFTEKDIENMDAVQCEKCTKKILADEAYTHEFYQDKELTIFLEDVFYCDKCAKKLFTKEEFEWGGKKEWAYL